MIDETPAAEPLTSRVRRLLAGRESREVRMFGGTSFMVNGRMAVASRPDGSLLVRTHPSRYDRLLQLGAEPARMGPDSVMGRGWIAVPPGTMPGDGDLLFWIDIGLDSQSPSDHDPVSKPRLDRS